MYMYPKELNRTSIQKILTCIRTKTFSTIKDNQKQYTTVGLFVCLWQFRIRLQNLGQSVDTTPIAF